MPDAGKVERNRGRRGSQVVEVAYVILPFFGLIFLLTDLCFTMYLRSTFQAAVREGVRYGVTGQIGYNGAGCQEGSIKNVVKAWSGGFIGPDNESVIKIRYYDGDTLAETGSNLGGNIIEVSIEDYTWTPLAPLFRSSAAVPIFARASDRIEPSPGGVAPCK